MGEASEEYEIIDLSKYRDNDWVKKILGDVSRQTAAKQVLIGGASGWVAGFLCLKVGKMAAVSLGTTVLLVQIAQHQGYIKIDWDKVERGVNHAKKELHKEAAQRYPGLVENAQNFMRKNVLIAGSFACGFLFGVAF